MELLIVIAITGIVATAMLGVVRNQTAAARRAATDDAVRSTRGAISLYREQTNKLPDLISGWEPLIRRNKVDGKFVGPFMNRAPRNENVGPGGNPSCIADGNLAVLYLNQCSFLYDYASGAGTGRFIASYEAQPAAPPAIAAEPAVVAGAE